MSAPDIRITAGTSGSIGWRFKTSAGGPVIDLTGSVIRLVVTWMDGAIRRSSADGGLTVNGAAGEVTWAWTPAESRSLPLGRVARYGLERRIDGGQELLAAGCVIAEEAPNDD